MNSDPANASIVAAFDAAAQSYDALTQVQRDVARALVARAAKEFFAPRTILDLGAGTGHVSELALRQWPHAELTALDAAPAMLARLRAKFPQVATIRRDAARLDGVGRYDLILSSMMLHWLDAPRDALAHWRGHLAPGGLLCVAAPVVGSLREWRDFARTAGIEDGLWAFPPEDFADGLGATVEISDFPAEYRDARVFLRALKGSGAHKSRPGALPAPAGALRRLLAQRSDPFKATFRIALLSLQAD
ncbi:methyltransferase domain-containing protein [Rhodoblastus sp. 17X3]|uniref:methyltransferase domain-containing protein n=1 Tax=Rhodoblastus sp. 17X3 TaxID=3047026 RepID=UPI0024B7E4AF|nr:methyltransferase domain-containing protein [Rhodoblastus sp. 17X3]MDI9849454.1 methyltransferase domain-containing protein [Rhodoblastus sp. 17X3]